MFAVFIEEMARVCGATGRITVEANMGAISAVMQYGTEKQKRLAAELHGWEFGLTGFWH
jgi:3-sulfinopropanoyl-CoA desulfinase